MSDRSVFGRGRAGVCMTAFLIALTSPVTAFADSALRDPTRPPDFSTVPAKVQLAAAPLELESILIGPERRIAVINQMVVTEGEVFAVGSDAAGGRVLEIQSDSVLVSRNGNATRLHLPQVSDVRRARIHK